MNNTELLLDQNIPKYVDNLYPEKFEGDETIVTKTNDVYELYETHMKHRFECLVNYATNFNNNNSPYKNIYIPVDNSNNFYLGVFKQHESSNDVIELWKSEFGKDNYKKFNTEINKYFEKLKQINKDNLEIKFIDYVKYKDIFKNNNVNLYVISVRPDDYLIPYKKIDLYNGGTGNEIKGIQSFTINPELIFKIIGYPEKLDKSVTRFPPVITGDNAQHLKIEKSHFDMRNIENDELFCKPLTTESNNTIKAVQFNNNALDDKASLDDNDSLWNSEYEGLSSEELIKRHIWYRIQCLKKFKGTNDFTGNVFIAGSFDDSAKVSD